MSQKHKRAQHAREILEEHFRVTSYSYRDVIITDATDIETCRGGMILLWLVWFDLLGVDTLLLKRLIRGWINAVPVIPIDVVAAVLSECDELLLSSIDTDDYPSYTQLLRCLRLVDDRAGSIIGPIRTLLVDALWSNTTEAIAKAHQALVFIKKLNIRHSNEVLDIEMMDAWVDHDIFVHDPEAGKLRPFYRRYFKYFTMEDAVPSHGDGAVADVPFHPDIIEKYRLMKSDDLTRYLDHRIGYYPLYYSDEPLRRQSLLKVVPKAVNKRRVITHEPCTLVWYQHAVRDAIIRTIKSSSLSRRINLDKPELNRDLAYRGSISGDFVTIDLSSASDSITWDGLQQALPAKMLSALTAVRSVSTELPDGSVYYPNKFAGMGNAVTFIVECTYFAAICEQAIREAGGDPRLSLYRVYGDDIVVERSYAQSVISCLERHGFQVNGSKSFTGCGKFIFRESCGGEYLNGVEVTPIRLSKGFMGLSVAKSGSIQGLIDLANRLPESLASARICVKSVLFSLDRLHLPHQSIEGKGLHMRNPDQSEYVNRYSFRYQETIYRHGESRSINIRPTHERHEDKLTRGNVRKTIYKDGFCEVVRYEEYLRSVRNRKSLLWPDDLIDVQLELPDLVVWGITSDPDRYY